MTFEPQILLTWTSVATVVAIGLATFFSTFRKQRQERLSEADRADLKLISVLKDTVSVLEKKVFDLENNQKDNIAQINKLTGENNIMKQLLQGRDTDSDKIKTESLVAFKKINEVHENVSRLYTLIEQHLKIMSEK